MECVGFYPFKQDWLGLRDKADSIRGDSVRDKAVEGFVNFRRVKQDGNLVCICLRLCLFVSRRRKKEKMSLYEA